MSACKEEAEGLDCGPSGLPDPSDELGSSNRKRKTSGDCEEEEPLYCASCEDVVQRPISTSCGHLFCRQCISSYREQSAPFLVCSCPKCNKRSRVELKTVKGGAAEVQQSVSSERHAGLMADGTGSEQLNHVGPERDRTLVSRMEVEEDSIAVVGMGCNFPGGEGMENFWNVLAEGRNCSATVPKDRFDLASWCDPDGTKVGKSCTEKAALVDRFNDFDNKYFDISDTEAEQMDPQQKQLLQCVYRALEDAGLPMEKASGTRTGVFFGIMNRDYESNGGNIHPSLMNHYTGTGLAMSIAANRVSYCFNFTGPSLTLDTACSSSLVALHLACQSIKQGECEMAVCGGVNFITEPRVFVVLSRAKMISPEGTSKPFSSRADGYGRGEGCGVVLLKPLKKALEDHDNIWGIISKTAVNQDGRTVSPITKPSMTQQEELLRRIYSDSDIAKVQYVEAHGTGTPAGDPTEAQSISNVIAKDRPCGSEALWIGSVKGNIGHTESAAGIAGVIKVMLMMKHKTIVPSVFYSDESCSVDTKSLNIKIPMKPEPWESSRARVAGVNNFGFGGTNAHAIIKQHTQCSFKHRCNKRPVKYFVVSAGSPNSLTMMIENTIRQLDAQEEVDLDSLLYTSACRRSHQKHKYRKAILTSSIADLKGKLCATVGQNVRPALSNPKLVFVYCGNGVNYHGMCKQLLKSEPVFRESIKDISQLFQLFSSLNILDRLESDFERSDFKNPDVVQPLLFAVQVSITKLLRCWGVKPDAVLGHSVGEVAAAHCSGLLSLEDALKVIYFRSSMQSKVTGGKMLVISNMAVSEVTSLLLQYPGRVSLAAFNSPQSCTLSGDADAIDSIHRKLNNSDSSSTLFLRALDVPSAYHSQMMDPILPEIRKTIGLLQTCVPETELYSTVTGKEVQQGDFCTGEYWARNIREPVAFEQALRVAVKENRNAVFLEVGPRKALQRNIMETLGNNTAVLASVEPQREQESTISVVSKLFELGVAVDWNSFYKGYETIPLPFPRYHFDCSDRDVIIAATKNNKGSSHPVLYQTGREDNLFICDLTSESTSYLKEHKHNDVPIIPGAFYVDLGLAAFLAITRPKVPLNSLQISVSFHKPSVLTQNSPEMKVQLTQKENETSFSVFSSFAEYASGSVVSKEGLIEERWISLSSIQKRCTSVVNFQQFYSYLSEQGFQYGDVFKNKADIHHGKELMEAFVPVSIPEKLQPHLHECCIHPVVLDYLMQLLPVTLKHITTDRVGFPAKVGSLTVFQPLRKEMIIYLRATHVGIDHFEVCGCFADMEGRVLVEAKDVMFKDLSNYSHIEEYFYHNIFDVVQKDSITSPPPKALVFSDELGISDGLKQHLNQESRYVSFTHVKHILKEGFLPHLASLNITDIEKNFNEALFLWYTKDLTSLPSDALLQDLLNCCDVFRRIVVELRQIKFPHAIRVVTYRSSDITVDRISPGFVFAGLIRSFAAEMSDLSFQLIDMGLISPENITALSQVLREYPCKKFPELVVKDGQILRPSIVHTPLDFTDRAEGKCIAANSEPYILQTSNGYRMTQLSALHFNKDPGPICDTYVEIRLSKICVHSSDYFPVSDSHLKSGQTLYWNKHSSQEHKLVALDFSGIVTAVGKGVTTLKVGDHIASCYPVVAANKVRVPEAVCYSTETLPFLRETPCVSFFVLAWQILQTVSNRSKQNLGILCSETHAALVHVLTQISVKLGWNVLVSTHSEDYFDCQLDALVLVPPFDETMMAKIADLSGLQVVVLLGESQDKGALVQEFFQSVRDSVYMQTVQMQEVLQKGSLRAQGPQVLQWLKSLSLEKCAPEIIPFQNVKSEALSTCSEVSASYFSSKKLAVVSLQEDVDGNTSDISVLPTKKQFFEERAVYIVTGGLSGLGFETIKFISQRGACHIVSLSRSKPSAEMQQEMYALEKEHGSRITSMQCDVAVFENVLKVITAIGQKFPGCPIKGVFHSAVVLHDGIIEALDRSLYEKVFKPKVNGVLNLHHATKHCPLDYFVCYSSISSFLGNPSQSNYAAANSFLDLFCHYRRQLGLPGQSINWGALKLGLLHNKETLQQILEVYGIMGLELAEIRKSLEQCLMLNRPQQAVCRFNFKNISYNVFSHNSSLTMRLYALVEEAIRNSRQGFFQTKQINSIPPREYIKTLLIETLGLNQSEMTDESFLSALGMDSMQAMTVQNLILQERSVNIPLVKLLDPAATLSTLVASLTEAEM